MASFDRTFRGNEVILNIICIQVRNMAIETDPLHAFIAFIFFVLLGFVQIRYPENPTPFQLHPKTTIVSIVSFLIYCLAFLGRHKFAIRVHHHFDTLMHVFGSLSLISLALLLLPANNTWESTIMYTLLFITHVLVIIFRNRFRDIWLQRQQQRRRVPRPLLPTTSMDLN